MLFGLFSRRHIRNLDDTEIVNLVKEGNTDALGELFQRYSPLIMGLSLKYFKNVQEAEDLMMILFEKLPGKLKKGEVKNFKNWLYSVCRNECLMELRKKKVETGDLEKVEFGIENESAQLLEEALQKEDMIAALETALLELNEEQRICVDLFYLKKTSYDEITSKTGYPLKKVKSYIQNGKRNLKLILEKNGELK